jgi:hypothetical protein
MRHVLCNKYAAEIKAAGKNMPKFGKTLEFGACRKQTIIR